MESWLLRRDLPVKLEEAVERVGGALRAEGFALLSPVASHELLGERLGRDLGRFVVLGVRGTAPLRSDGDGAQEPPPLRVLLSGRQGLVVVVASDPADGAAAEDERRHTALCARARLARVMSRLEV